MKRIGTFDKRFHDADKFHKGTVIPASWLNDVQEEISNAIEQLGGRADGSTQSQLGKLISSNIESKSDKTHTHAGLTEAVNRINNLVVEVNSPEEEAKAFSNGALIVIRLDLITNINYTTVVMNQDGKSKIVLPTKELQYGLARIAVASTKMQTGMASVFVPGLIVKTQYGKANILNKNTYTEIGISNIRKSVTKTQNATSRIAAVKGYTQGGRTKVVVAGVSSYTQQGLSRILNTVAKAMTGKAKVIKVSTYVENGKARIQIKDTFTQTGMAKVTTPPVQKTQTGKSNIFSNTTTRFQYAKANIIGASGPPPGSYDYSSFYMSSSSPGTAAPGGMNGWVENGYGFGVVRHDTGGPNSATEGYLRLYTGTDEDYNPSTSSVYKTLTVQPGTTIKLKARGLSRPALLADTGYSYGPTFSGPAMSETVWQEYTALAVDGFANPAIACTDTGSDSSIWVEVTDIAFIL